MTWIRRTLEKVRASRYGQFLARFRPASDMFSIVNVETFAYCNRKCDFCFNGDRFPKRDLGIMEEALWRKIVDELGSINFAGRLSPHFYGEPILDKRLPGLIAYARSRCPRARIRVNSNGDLLNEDLLKTLIESGMDRILTTNYDETANEVCEDLAARYPGQVTHRTQADLFKANRAGRLFEDDDGLGDEPCLRPSERLIVNWKGNVVLCCNDFYEAHVFGNVQSESLVAIWRKPAFKAIRERLAARGGRRSVAICRGCNQQ